MKSVLKSKLFWLTVVVVAASAALAAHFWPKPQSQVITLASGDQFEFVAAKYGTNLVPPSLLCHIAHGLPASLTNLAAKLLGSRVRWFKEFTPEHPELVLWFRRVRTANPTAAPGSVRDTMLRAGIADEGEFEVWRDNEMTLFPERSMWVQPASGWSFVALGNLPKRSPVLQVTFLEDGKSDFQKITLRNPLYGDYPQWQPKDTLPATRDLDDLHVEIGKLEFQHQSGNFRFPGQGTYLQTQVSWPPAPRTLPNWNLIGAGLDDATGNHLDEIPPHVFGSHTVGRGVNFPVGFWPGEDAWRLKLTFKRVANFPPDAVLTFKNVPIPPMGATNFIPITNSLGGVKIRISQFTHDHNATQAGQPPYSYIGVDLPERPANMVAEIIDLQTPDGKPASSGDFLWGNSSFDSEMYPSPLVQLSFIPTNAATMDITVAIQKLRTVELYIKPPAP